MQYLECIKGKETWTQKFVEDGKPGEPKGKHYYQSIIANWPKGCGLAWQELGSYEAQIKKKGACQQFSHPV